MEGIPMPPVRTTVQDASRGLVIHLQARRALTADEARLYALHALARMKPKPKRGQVLTIPIFTLPDD